MLARGDAFGEDVPNGSNIGARTTRKPAGSATSGNRPTSPCRASRAPRPRPGWGVDHPRPAVSVSAKSARVCARIAPILCRFLPQAPSDGGWSAAYASGVDERVLLVEDDPSIREVTVLGLEQAGFKVTGAADGREGLARFREGGFALVVLDVMLPELDGFEVCRAIRRESRVPIVMLSARSDTVDVVVGLELGADDYVTKPFELAELVARARAALRRASEAPAEETIVVGELEIEPAAFAVRRRGEEVPLTATELRLLVELARRPRPGLHARAPARAGLGLRLPRRLAARGRRRPAAAREDRGRPGQSRDDRDGARRGLPPRLRLMRDRIPTGRLRRRLTIAFALVAGLSALALAAGSYAVVRQARLDDSVDRALAQARFNLGFAAEVLEGSGGEQATNDLLAAFERRGDFDTVGTTAGRNFSSSLSVDYAQVPPDLQALVQDGQLAYERVDLGGEPSLVAGGKVAGSDTELYFVFSEQEL